MLLLLLLLTNTIPFPGNTCMLMQERKVWVNQSWSGSYRILYIKILWICYKNHNLQDPTRATYCILNRILLRYFLGSCKIFNTTSYRISSQDVMEDSDKTALGKMVRHDERKRMHSFHTWWKYISKWSWKFCPTPGRLAITGIPSFFKSSAFPIPDKLRS